MVSGISFDFSYCGLHITPFSHPFVTKYETNNTNFIIIKGMTGFLSLECARAAQIFFHVLDHARATQKVFPWFFHTGILKFHDFSMILAFFSNSMIFPGLENAFFIFQVFHDFPWRWEPCAISEWSSCDTTPQWYRTFLQTTPQWYRNHSQTTPRHFFFLARQTPPPLPFQME